MATIRKRLNSKGETSFHVQVRIKGYTPETASFSRLTDAKHWAQNIESAMREGRHFKTSASKKHTLGEAIDRYDREVLSHRKNPVNQKKYLSYWKDALGHSILADISSSVIVEKRNALVGMKNKYGREISTVTANRYTQSLGHVLTVAMKDWEWINDNPVSKMSKFKEPRGRVRFLSDEERKNLLQACQHSENPFLYTIVVLALSTGARKNEILSLTWSQVNLERRTIILNETKNDERRSLPLQGLAYEMVKAQSKLRIVGCEYVFPSKKVSRGSQGKFIYQPIDIRTAWENALKNAEIEDFRFHDLRHSAASYLAMNGASLAEIADVLGHKTLSMVKRYAHLSEAHTHNVVSKMNDRIFGDG
tara:strand:- start:4492 stop:5580 length:1089 start_codon:yes stop_codon:yes gene_type:complete